MKRYLIICIALFIGQLTDIKAYDIEVDGFYYNIIGNTLEVTYCNNKYNSYEGKVAIHIPSTVNYENKEYEVTSIGSNAFNGCSDLLSVVLPNTVTTIKDYAFYECTNLVSIVFGSAIKDIGIRAFSGYNSYYVSKYYHIPIKKAIWLGNTAPEGRSEVFAEVNYVSSKTFGDISDRMVYPFLSSIFEVDGVIYVPVSPSDRTCDIIDCNYSYSSRELSIDSVVINKGIELKVLDVNLYSFYKNDSISSLNISNRGLIGEYAFTKCRNLTSIIAHNNGYIGREAFSGCTALRTANISNNGYIKFNAFSGCTALRTANISNNGYIDWGAFSGCTALETANISNNGYIGSGAFRECTALETANISNNGYIGSSAFSGCTALYTATIECNGDIQKEAFKNCSNLTSISLGNNINSIGDSAFEWNKALTEIIIPDNVNSLGKYVFKDCKSLSDVKIGKGVEILSKGLFSGCSSLLAITIPSQISSIEDDVFYGCTHLGEVNFEESTQRITLGVSSVSPLFASCELVNVYIGRPLKYDQASSAKSPFYDNKTLQRVKITDSETTIYDNEFYGCSNLQEFSCGDGITTIGERAFSGCSSLKSYFSGSSVKSIGAEAFSDCTALISFTSTATNPPVCGSQALDDINKWECTLSVPQGSIESYRQASQWKDFFFIEVSGVEDIITDQNDNQLPIEIYNIDGIMVGQKTEGLIPGLYFLRQGNKTKKILVK